MSFSDILQNIEDTKAKKLAQKVPEWKDIPVSVPSSLNLEQCSSSATAGYKAALASAMSSDAGLKIADLTGGLGVDSFFFSRVAGTVLYNERDTTLSMTVRENFGKLGVGNVEFLSLNAESAEMAEILKQFRPDVIFMDPARRNASGRKVFLLEDCSPDVVPMLETIFGICPVLMIKLSPMVDITMLQKRLNGHLEEVHIIESRGECKEILCILKRRADKVSVTVTDLSDSFSFYPDEEAAAEPSPYSPSEGDILFEPGPALMKSGAFKLVCGRFGLGSICRESHLYCCRNGNGAPFGKSFRILKILPFSVASVKEAGKLFPLAEVSAKGIKMKSDELKARLGVKSGGDTHIFGTTLLNGNKVLLVCKTIC